MGRFNSENDCCQSVQYLLCYVVCLRQMYRYLVFPFALYGRETWPVSFREERRLWVFEIRVLRKMFGPKREEATKE
jgi:hypothetical protein